MRLDWALLANAAEAPPNGLVYILGAGFDTLVRDQYPTPFGGVIVLRLQTTRLETERPHKVEVHCSDEDGNPLLQQGVAVLVAAMNLDLVRALRLEARRLEAKHDDASKGRRVLVADERVETGA